MLATVKRWHDWAFEWSGSAFIADEEVPGDMSSAEHKSELYSGLCGLGNTMAWLHEQLSALASLSQPVKGERESDKRSQGHYDRDGYCDNPARGY